MGDHTPPSQINLDLNLGPVEESLPGYVSLDLWLEEPIRRIRQAITQRSPFRRMPSLQRESEWGPRPYTPTTSPIALDLINENEIETGQGSITAEERPTDEVKACDNDDGVLEDSVFGKKENLEKENRFEGSFFDCNICLDLANDPVVTCCGHLFCWPCIYMYLHVHSDCEKCPVCKGEVNLKNMTPIYGGGNDNRTVKIDSKSVEIPPRPKAHRVESWRQTFQRDRYIPLDELDEIILQGDFDFGSTRYLDQESDLVDLNNPYVDLATRHINTDLGEIGDGSPRLDRISNLESTLNLYDRIIGSLLLSHQVLTDSVGDRDSVSSIAGVIQSESQTIDTAAEIDSRVSRSTSSSRRRNESRVSDVDSGETRPPRRRRFQ